MCRKSIQCRKCLCDAAAVWSFHAATRDFRDVLRSGIAHECRWIYDPSSRQCSSYWNHNAIAYLLSLNQGCAMKRWCCDGRSLSVSVSVSLAGYHWLRSAVTTQPPKPSWDAQKILRRHDFFMHYRYNLVCFWHMRPPPITWVLTWSDRFRPSGCVS